MTADSSRTATPLDVLIVGSGFGGLGMGVALAKEGKRSFALLERAAELGGTWRDNTYPGCACDIPSHLYSFSFEPNPNWSRMYPTQPEIKTYLAHVARKYRVLPHIRFGRTMCGARFDATSGTWHVDTLEGESFQARALVFASGGLSKPRIPRLAGAQSFRGRQMHSARWDAAYDLSGKRVAIIGTGASAAQIVPEITGLAARVHVFQRSAPWVLPKPDRPMKPWERRVFRWLPVSQRLLRARIFRLNETLGEFILGKRDLATAQAAAVRFMERQVVDPELRAKVTPDYTLGCKRMLFSNDWYGSLQLPHVELVTEPIARLEEHGIVTDDGRVREVDCVIYGTGFDVHGTSRLEVRGLDGCTLANAWQERREAYLGCTVAGFPNLFFVIGPNSGTGHNSLVYIMECQIRYIMKLLRTLDRRQAAWVQPTAESQRAYNDELQRRLARSVWTQGRCHSWYQDTKGQVTTLWPGLLTEYRHVVRAVDEAAFEWRQVR